MENLQTQFFNVIRYKTPGGNSALLLHETIYKMNKKKTKTLKIKIAPPNPMPDIGRAKPNKQPKQKKYKPIKSLSELHTGDIIRNKIGVKPYVVIANYGTHVTAVNAVDVTNIIEWLKFD